MNFDVRSHNLYPAKIKIVLYMWDQSFVLQYAVLVYLYKSKYLLRLLYRCSNYLTSKLNVETWMRPNWKTLIFNVSYDGVIGDVTFSLERSAYFIPASFKKELISLFVIPILFLRAADLLHFVLMIVVNLKGSDLIGFLWINI